VLNGPDLTFQSSSDLNIPFRGRRMRIHRPTFEQNYGSGQYVQFETIIKCSRVQSFDLKSVLSLKSSFIITKEAYSECVRGFQEPYWSKEKLMLSAL